MHQSLPPIESLIRHRGRMLLIERLLEASETHAVGEVVITEKSSFFRKGSGVPIYVGMEYMAQTVAAYDGLLRCNSGDEPAIGFLLGSRRYEAIQDYFPNGAVLAIHVDMVFSEGGMASFECFIKQGDQTLVTAPLNVYRPESGEFSLPERAI